MEHNGLPFFLPSEKKEEGIRGCPALYYRGKITLKKNREGKGIGVSKGEREKKD